MTTTALERLGLLHTQLQQDPAHIPKLPKGNLKQMGAIVHAAASGLQPGFLQKPLTAISIDGRHRTILRSCGIRTVGDLVQALPDGGRCAIRAYALAVITMARLLNLLPELPTHQITDAELQALDSRFRRWLEEEPLPAELRSAGFLLVTRTRGGIIRYAGFVQIAEVLKALNFRCNHGALDTIECIADLLHSQKLEVVARVQAV